MAAQEHQKIFFGPGEGAHLPVLDIVHKVTAESSGGTLSILEWGLPPGQMIPPPTGLSGMMSASLRLEAASV